VNRKADLGIGTLIIFIAFVLLAAIAAGILLQTAGSMQEKALMTGEDTKNNIVTAVNVLEVSATDGTNGSVRFFDYTVKGAAGSNPIKLNDTVLNIHTNETQSTLRFAGLEAVTSKGASGYYTNTREWLRRGGWTWNDYDLDGALDYIHGGLDGEHAYLNISSAGITSIGYCSGGLFVSNFTDYSYLKSASGQCDQDNVTWVEIAHINESSGVYSIQYLQKGTNWVEGNLQRGDVIKFYFEAPRNMSADDIMRFTLVPQTGAQTFTPVRMPRVIAQERVYVYP
jgi:flagellin-like protein